MSSLHRIKKGDGAGSDSLNKTLQERGDKYGLYEEQAAVAQALQYILTPYFDKLKPDQRDALQMVCCKISRVVVGDPNYIDNWHDIAGYARLVESRLISELNEGA